MKTIRKESEYRSWRSTDAYILVEGWVERFGMNSQSGGPDFAAKGTEFVLSVPDGSLGIPKCLCSTIGARVE
jgi:hypothetical protein